jgi:hypothetical protein
MSRVRAPYSAPPDLFVEMKILAAIAQLVERVLGKDEVPSSNLGGSSKTRNTRLLVHQQAGVVFLMA